MSEEKPDRAQQFMQQALASRGGTPSGYEDGFMDAWTMMHARFGALGLYQEGGLPGVDLFSVVRGFIQNTPLPVPAVLRPDYAAESNLWHFSYEDPSVAARRADYAKAVVALAFATAEEFGHEWLRLEAERNLVRNVPEQ